MRRTRIKASQIAEGLPVTVKTRDSSKKMKAEDGHDIKRMRGQSSSQQDSTNIKISDGYLQASEDELNLDRTLLGGQSFRWRKQSLDGDCISNTCYTGPIGNAVFRLWRETSDRITFKCYQPLDNISKDTVNPEAVLRDYFRFDHDLLNLYKHWSDRDENFSKRAINYSGFRILRQDPVENVFSFICATNNNIKRISGMVESMCERFGQYIMTIDGSGNDPGEDKKSSGNQKSALTNSSQQSAYDLRMQNEAKYYSFPTIKRLSEDDVYECLRHELGFGYRAKFIVQSAELLLILSDNAGFMDPREYLLSLRKMPYDNSCSQLQKLPGIGRKVADCICLMSMDHLGSVPTDCHIYEIVCRDYMRDLKKERKSLTESVHNLIGKYFRELHGPLAGWSTSVLFVAELKHLQEDKDLKKTKVKTKVKKSNIDEG